MNKDEKLLASASAGMKQRACLQRMCFSVLMMVLSSLMLLFDQRALSDTAYEYGDP